MHFKDLAAVGLTLLATTVLASYSPTKDVPACCRRAKQAQSAAQPAGKMRCSLTGKVVDKCCCDQGEGGVMHCTLANKDVPKCCCSPTEEGKQAS